MTDEQKKFRELAYALVEATRNEAWAMMNRDEAIRKLNDAVSKTSAARLAFDRATGASS